MTSGTKILAVAAIAAWIAGCATDPAHSRRPGDPFGQYDDAALLNLELGIRYLQQGNMPVAEEKLLRTLALDPKIPEAHNTLGVLYEATDRTKLAEGHYRRAVALDAQYDLARMNYGRLLCERGDYTEGIEQFRQVLNGGRVEATVSVYAGLGTCELGAGNLDQAGVTLERALDLDPRHPASLLSMADLELQMGNPGVARGLLDRHLNFAPVSGRSLWVAMQIASAVGDTRLRDEYALQLRTDFPDSHEAARLRVETDKLRRAVQ